jgi:hypothetical protein
MKVSDVVLIVFILAISLFFLHSSNISNPVVVIQHNNKIIGEYPLNVDRKVSFNGSLGKMKIEIKNNKVRMIESNCPLHLCMKEGWVDKPSQPIICIPNKVIVYIKSSKSQDLITK